MVERIPREERAGIGAMGRFGIKERNLEGEMLVDLAKRKEIILMKTYFQ